MIIFFIFCYSVDIFFDGDLVITNFFKEAEKIGLAIFCLDMILNFTVGYFSKGTEITDLKLIASNYIRSGFIFDFLSNLSLLWNIVNFPPIAYLEDFIIFLKVVRISIIYKRLTRLFRMRETTKYWVELVDLLAFVMYLFIFMRNNTF
jgi:hypothetical protein